MFTSMLAILGFKSIALFSSATIQTTICNQNDTTSVPVIAQPQNGATGSTTTPIQINGSAAGGSTVTFSDNGTNIGMVQADTNGDFGLQVSLPAGDHSLVFTATDGCDTANTSPIIIHVSAPATSGGSSGMGSSGGTGPTGTNASTSIASGGASTFTSTGQTGSASSISTSGDTGTAPQVITNGTLSLSILNPVDQAIVTATSISVIGSTNEPATITVLNNGAVAASSSILQTSFGFDIPLTSGDNTITVLATDADGTTTVTASVLVTSKSQYAKITQKWYTTTPGHIIIASTATASFLAIALIILLILL